MRQLQIKIKVFCCVQLHPVQHSGQRTISQHKGELHSQVWQGSKKKCHSVYLEAGSKFQTIELQFHIWSRFVTLTYIKTARARPHRWASTCCFNLCWLCPNLHRTHQREFVHNSLHRLLKVFFSQNAFHVQSFYTLNFNFLTMDTLRQWSSVPSSHAGQARMNSRMQKIWVVLSSLALHSHI